jgi:hypothetical protein
MDYKAALKLLVQATLVTVFLVFFGIKSWERFEERKVVVTTAEEDHGSIFAPAVTVCPQNPETQVGLKNWTFNSKTMMDIVNSDMAKVVCEGKTYETIEQCIQNEAYNLTDAVTRTSKGFQSGHDKISDRFWNPEFSYVQAGLCHTLEANLTMGTDRFTEALRIELNENLTYWTFIHDPNLFLLNLNLDLPLNRMLLLEPKNKLIEMIVVKHHNLDVPSKRCNADPTYSFTGCIKQALSGEVGCRLPWDRWTDMSIPLCDQLHQYK